MNDNWKAITAIGLGGLLPWALMEGMERPMKCEARDRAGGVLSDETTRCEEYGNEVTLLGDVCARLCTRHRRLVARATDRHQFRYLMAEERVRMLSAAVYGGTLSYSDALPLMEEALLRRCECRDEVRALIERTLGLEQPKQDELKPEAVTPAEVSDGG